MAEGRAVKCALTLSTPVVCRRCSRSETSVSDAIANAGRMASAAKTARMVRGIGRRAYICRGQAAYFLFAIKARSVTLADFLSSSHSMSVATGENCSLR